MMKKRDRLRWLPWLSFALWLPVTLLVARQLWLSWGFSGVRLVRALGLWRGETLFPMAGEGWIHISLYGPVAAAAYLPALLPAQLGFSSPALAIMLGQILAMVFYFLPAILLIQSASPESDHGHTPKRRWDGASWAALIFFAVISLDLWSLRYVAMTVHSDGPTLALAALACACFLHWGESRRGFAMAALFVVLAMWSKQVALGVPFALTTFIAWRHGRRAFFRFAAWGAFWSLSVSVAVVVIFGPIQNLIYHLITVPGLHGWRWGGGWRAFARSARLMLEENPSLLALAALALLLHLLARSGPLDSRGRAQRESWRAWILERPWLLLFWVALCQIPFALIGRLKIGGDVNAYSHSLYYLLLGVVLALRSGTELRSNELTRRWSRLLLYGAPLVIMVVVATVQEKDLLSTWDPSLEFSDHPYEIAARYAAAYPGEVYFPRMTLATGLVEKRLDHQVAGLIDLLGADHSPTARHWRSGLPPEVNRVAIYGDYMVEQVGELEPYMHLERLPDDPELPGFWIYRADFK